MTGKLEHHDHVWSRVASTHTEDARVHEKENKAAKATLYIRDKVANLSAKVTAHYKISWKERVGNFFASIFGHKKIIVVKKGDETKTIGRTMYVRVDDLAKALNLKSSVVRNLIANKLFEASMTPPAAVAAVAAPAMQAVAPPISKEVPKRVEAKVIKLPPEQHDSLKEISLGKKEGPTGASPKGVQPAKTGTHAAKRHRKAEVEKVVVDGAARNEKTKKKKVKDKTEAAEKTSPTIKREAEQVRKVAAPVITPESKTVKEQKAFERFLLVFVKNIIGGEALEDEEKASLLALGRAVGFDQITDLLTEFPGALVIKDDATTEPKIIPQHRMLNTLILAGKALDTLPAGEKFVAPKQKNLTFSFLIDEKKNVFVTTSLLGKGSFKKVSDTIKLKNLNEPKLPMAEELSVRATVVGDWNVKGAFAENALVEKFYKLSPHVVSPYKITVETKNKKSEPKLVLLQQKYDGDGYKIPPNQYRQAVKALADCAAGLAAMHKAGFVHCDFKTANFLIQGNPQSDKLIEGKVADLGAVKQVGESVGICTLLYSPPERFGKPKNATDVPIYKEVPASDKFDSYSLGVTLFDRVFGGSLSDELIKLYRDGFCIANKKELKEQLKTLKFSNPINKEQEFKNAVHGVMMKLLHPKPDMRMSCADAAVELNKILATA